MGASSRRIGVRERQRRSNLYIRDLQLYEVDDVAAMKKALFLHGRRLPLDVTLRFAALSLVA